MQRKKKEDKCKERKEEGGGRKKNNLQEKERSIETAKGIPGCGMMKNGPRVATR